MEGPPIKMHIDTAATPKARHTAAIVPLHWQQRVYNYLLQDEGLGVIECVPYGKSDMVPSHGSHSEARQLLWTSPLNKFCQRETFTTESPFHLARRIPMDTWKTIMGAWNSFHSVPLCELDHHLTIWGRLQPPF